MVYFNPRSLAGATIEVMFIRQLLTFQSTLPRGSDFNEGQLIPYFVDISIHAPSRERRLKPKAIVDSPVISIHAPSRERQLSSFPLLLDNLISIHAPSRERQMLCVWSLLLAYFNPRSLAGATSASKFLAVAAFISIHAPSRERRYYNLPCVDYTTISIHAPSRERPKAAQKQADTAEFQSTLPRGSDE